MQDHFCLNQISVTILVMGFASKPAVHIKCCTNWSTQAVRIKMDLGNEIEWRRIEFVQLGKVIRQQRQNNLVKISLFLKIDLPKKCGQPLFAKQPLKHTHTHTTMCVLLVFRLFANRWWWLQMWAGPWYLARILVRTRVAVGWRQLQSFLLQVIFESGKSSSLANEQWWNGDNRNYSYCRFWFRQI